MISLVVAAALNNVIGRKGDLPWHLPADLVHFKRVTMGKPIVMGRRTFESIGQPLPGRHNIVLSRRTGYPLPGCTVIGSPAAALEAAGAVPEVMIIGGHSVYRSFLPLAERIYLTRVNASVDGDTFFPELDEYEWSETSREERAADATNEFGTTLVLLERRSDRQSG